MKLQKCVKCKAWRVHEAKGLCKKCYSTKIRKDMPSYSPEKWRLYHVKRFYGLNEEAYLKLLTASQNHCMICAKEGLARNLNVDHSHKTGKVRGLLCYNCNNGLGSFKDNLSLLLKAVLYLLKYELD